MGFIYKKINKRYLKIYIEKKKETFFLRESFIKSDIKKVFSCKYLKNINSLIKVVES